MCPSIPMSLCTQRYVEIQLYLYIQNLMQEVFLLFITLQTGSHPEKGSPLKGSAP